MNFTAIVLRNLQFLVLQLSPNIAVKTNLISHIPLRQSQ